jgi:hypothetical protein
LDKEYARRFSGQMPGLEAAEGYAQDMLDLALENVAKKQAAKKRQKVGKKPQKGEKEEYARKNLRRTQLLMKRPKIGRRAEGREGFDSDFSEGSGGDEEEEM